MNIMKLENGIFTQKFKNNKINTDGKTLCAIGDIHGSFKLMKEMVKYLGNQYYGSHLIFLGDLINKGEDSASCLLYAWNLKFNTPKEFSNVDILVGNHEQMLFSPLIQKDFPKKTPYWPQKYKTNHWLYNYVGIDENDEDCLLNCLIDSEYGFLLGENYCFDLYKKWMNYAFIPFLYKNQNLKNSPLFKLYGNIFFVHAGLIPKKNNLINQFKHIDLLNYKGNISKSPLWIDGNFLKNTNNQLISNNKEYFVVHGHTIIKKRLQNNFIDLKPICNRIGIDSGAFKTGILSSVVLKNKDIKIIQINEKKY